MEDYHKFEGAIIVLAYPEEMVSMIPAWYRKPMEWIGLVKNGKICAGHAAMMLVNKRTNELIYADFGRYITPFGYGRTRTKHTDPDVAFDFEIQTNDVGQISNKDEVLQRIYESPEKTHGGTVMFASFHEAIDFEACKKFIVDINSKGSIIYDPFKKDASNCSRFVHDAILAGMTSEKEKKRLKRKNILTPSPLGNVFHGSTSDTYVIRDGELEIAQQKSLLYVIQSLFKHSTSQEHVSHYEPTADMQQLTGIGDQSYYCITDKSKGKEGIYKISRTTNDGQTIYDHYFIDTNKQLDASQSYKFVHDCNALWATIEQNGRSIRLERYED